MALIQYWYWCLLALVLFAIGAGFAGMLYIWMALAALLSGAVVWLLPDLNSEYQFLLFSISLISIMAIVSVRSGANR